MAADLVFPPAAQPDIIRALQKDEVYVRVSCDRGGDFTFQEPGAVLSSAFLRAICSDAAARVYSAALGYGFAVRSPALRRALALTCTRSSATGTRSAARNSLEISSYSLAAVTLALTRHPLRPLTRHSCHPLPRHPSNPLTRSTRPAPPPLSSTHVTPSYLLIHSTTPNQLDECLSHPPLAAPLPSSPAASPAPTCLRIDDARRHARHSPAAPGRAWQILPAIATSLTRILNPCVLS